MKSFYVAANWKMHKNPEQTRKFFKNFLAQVQTRNHLIFFPPAANFESCASSLLGSSVKWGSQNCYHLAQGAFTGENSLQVVKEMGGTHALIGHSERRQFFGETGELLAKKVKFAKDIGMIPMLCVGESLTERDQGKTNQVLSEQLKQGLSLQTEGSNLMIAYEPVWAIGTGRVASVEQVQEAHAHIHQELNNLGMTRTPVLYGGSVKADNCLQLARLEGVDGFLVGGASLEVESFLPIAQVQF